MMDPDMAKEVQTKVILHWNYRGFKELPEELRIEGEHVKEVYLKWNDLHKLPQWLGVLRSLTNLYLYGNRLESLPKEIEELQSLMCLDVSENQLSSLPESICKLRYLTVLIATNNKLSSLPKDIHKLTSLQTLHLAENSLQILPESVCQCRSLEDLRLDQNNLLCLPSQIVYLPRLYSLSVSGNQLIYLPALPFATDVRLNFDENPCLNYLPFPLGCQITSRNGGNTDHWYLNCFGCFLRSLGDSAYLKNIILHVPPSTMWQNEAMQLVMPHELSHVYKQGSAQVPSLYEMTLRTVYTLLYHHVPQNIRLTRKHIFTTFRKHVDPKDRPHHLRLGHGGTLDSTATGVLVVGIGWGCKVLPKLLKGTKKYVVTGCLGTATETYNETGKVIMEKSYDHISLEMLEQVLKTFEGRIFQIPPRYSALKFHGRRIADWTREGKEIEMKPRPVFCYSVECFEFTPPNFKLKVSCGGGFYVRSLIHDLGLALDSCAHVTDLHRTQHGPFTEEDMLEPCHWTVDHISQAIVMAKDKYSVELQRPRGKSAQTITKS